MLAILQSLKVELVEVGSGFEAPVWVGHAGDGSGRLYVVEKAGRVRILGQDGRPAETFFDLSERIDSSGYEQGLLGLAFHPAFGENGRLFVNYTDSNGDTVVSELRASGSSGLVLSQTERRLLRIAQPASNHNGGHLAFGPDGYLYIGMGDGGAANDRFGNGQNLKSMLGKMLRIDVDSPERNVDPADGGAEKAYSVPLDNPLIGLENDGVIAEIWAWGLRNPWRFSFDRLDGALFIGDVGQNQREEIDWVPAASASEDLSPGLNFGWPIWEGHGCFQRHEDCTSREAQNLHQAPILEYLHSEAPGCSVTGGYVARGDRLDPSGAMYGTFFFGDYCSGLLFGAKQDDSGLWHQRTLLDTSYGISSFGEGEGGELYLCDLEGGGIYQIVEAD